MNVNPVKVKKSFVASPWQKKLLRTSGDSSGRLWRCIAARDFYGLAECMNCSPICCIFQKTPDAESHHASDHDGRAPLALSL
jgi:hypothetical protein